MPTRRHDFFELMRAMRQQMALQYDLISSRSRLDPGTAGDAVEEVWAAFLRSWLPGGFSVVTKGRVLASDGGVSPQFDIIVLEPWYPTGLQHTKYYFVPGVVAAFECKLTLRAVDIREAFLRAATLKKLWPPVNGNVRDELQRSVVVGVLAHSYARRVKSQPDVEPILKALEKHFAAGSPHPRDLLDILCVADTATLITSKTLCIPPYSDPDLAEMFRRKPNGEGVCAGMMYQDIETVPRALYNPRGDVLGGLIYGIASRLAYDRPELRTYVEYIEGAAMWFGLGQVIPYGGEFLSESVLARLRREGFEDERWSKWSDHV